MVRFKSIILIVMFFILSVEASIQAPIISIQKAVVMAQTDSSIASTVNVSDSSKKNLKLTPKTYNHKQQMILGVGMMAFIAIIFSTVQSWNP